MDRIEYDARELAASPGSADKVSGVIELEPFTLWGVEYSIPEGISYSATLSNVGDAIVLVGDAQAEVVGECTRCLEPASNSFASDLDGYYTLSPESDVEGMEEDEYEPIGEDGIIDITECITSAILSEIPAIFLCKDDCKGLCPSCGCNLNEEQCDCASKPDPSNPFSILSQITFDDE
ncbi:MAG: DUF177 domain-containing protein [bacterium]|nr:DUF177 domain-containing protein [bacterium]